jgi:Diaminopimelate decarboxylase
LYKKYIFGLKMNYFKLKKNNLFIENLHASKLVKKYKTPFYCYSLSELKKNFFNFKNAFKTVEPIICFSVKSNANLTILKELKKPRIGR